MPTYEYLCQACGHEFDAVQTFDEPSLTVCPECGGSLRKKFGSIGVVFKGPGFYRTDSREKPGGSRGDKKDANGKSGSDAKTDSGGKSEKPGSPEKKSAPKTEKSGGGESKSGLKSQPKSKGVEKRGKS